MNGGGDNKGDDDSEDIKGDEGEVKDLTYVPLLMLLCVGVVPEFLFLYLSPPLKKELPTLHENNLYIVCEL